MTGKPSRAASDLVAQIRSAIQSGQYAPGQFIRTTRELSVEYGVSPETVRKGLKHLEENGLLISEPRHGFRVSNTKQSPMTRFPVAFVTEYSLDLSDAQPVNWAFGQTLQKAVATRNWTTLSAHFGGRTKRDILDQLTSANAWGVILDTLTPALFNTISELELPVVMVNSWVEDINTDVVIQDNYRGGFLAAKHLVENGAEKFAWIGPVHEYCHSRERYAGALAGLLAHDKTHTPCELQVIDHASELESIKALLQEVDRPCGILAFWKHGSAIVRQAAEDLGLTIGQDLQIIGWSVEECLDSEHHAVFAGGTTPPVITWSAQAMVETALDRLAERHKRKDLQPVRITIPTQIRKSP